MRPTIAPLAPLRTIAIVVLAAACSRQTPAAAPIASPATREADSLALIALHQRSREAHLQRRADWLVAPNADTMYSVSAGRVSMGNRDRDRTSFQAYVDGVDFLAWDDITPPRIRISPDGQMAYTIVEKRVHLTPRGASQPVEKVRYAWVAIYEKRGGEWRMTAIASTDRPDDGR